MNNLDWNFVLGLLTGALLSCLVIYLVIKNIATKVMVEIDSDISKIKDMFVSVSIEKVNDQLFCYNKKNNQFICQGSNLEEIRTKFKERFPEKIAFISGAGDEQLIKDIKNQLKELNETGTGK